jgi:hypothetical protein
MIKNNKIGLALLSGVFIFVSAITGNIKPAIAEKTLYNPIINYSDTLVTASYTAKPVDTVIRYTNTGAIRTVTLYPVASINSKGRVIKIIGPSDTASYNLTIDGNGAETINGATTVVCNKNYGSIELKNNGTSWDIMNNSCQNFGATGSSNTFTGTNVFSGTNTFSSTLKLTGYTQNSTAIYETAISATTSPKIVVFRAARAVTITGLSFTVGTTLASHDTNYWTLAATNETQSESLLASSDLNTTKATGGIASGGGLVAFTASSATLTGTTANLNLDAGDVVTITATKAASAVDLVNLTTFVSYVDR